MSKTGGGRGTNQYAVRGASQAARQDASVLDGLAGEQVAPDAAPASAPTPAPAHRPSVISRLVQHPPVNFGRPCTSLRASGRPCRRSVRGDTPRCPRCYDELSQSPNIWQRALLARDPAALPERVAWRLARDPVAAVAAEMAHRSDLTDEIRSYLASSPHRLVQKTLQRAEVGSLATEASATS